MLKSNHGSSIIFSFIFTMLGFFIIVGTLCTSSGDKGSSSSPSSSRGSVSRASIPVPNWKSHAYVTDLEKEKRAYVESKTVVSDRPMDFPYTNTTATLNVVKNSSSTWAYIEFSQAPNVVGTDTQNGYHIIKANVYIDGVRETATMTQEWGSKTLHFRYPTWLIKKLRSCTDFRVNIRWHGDPGVVWSFKGTGFDSEYGSMQVKFNSL